MYLSRHHTKQASDLLPDDADAYPCDALTGEPMSPEKRGIIDGQLLELMAECPLPTEPGVYLDGDGDRWTLDPLGGWTDCKGVHHDVRYAPILGLFVGKGEPFRPATESREP